MMFLALGLTEADEPFALQLEYTKLGWSPTPQPPVLKWAAGFLMVDGVWPSNYTEKDNVRYEAWIESATTDWESANMVKEKVGGKEVWRQKLFLPPLRDGGRKKARIKMTFGYRPPGRVGGIVEEAGKLPRFETLPAVRPLGSGTYPFTFVLRRVVDGGAPEEVRQDFEVTINDVEGSLFFSGIEDNQVYQRTSKAAGEIGIDLGREKATKQTADVTVSKGDAAVLQKKLPVAKTDERLIVPGVPVGGPYTVEITCDGTTRKFANIYVGDLWIISGQSNAVGAGSNASLGKPAMPGVNGLLPRYGILEWRPASDGFFENTVGPWVTAAQEFYKKTGVPVGLIGQAMGSKAMDYFMDESHTEMPHLKPLIDRYGRKAANFFWYQGESDSFIPEMTEAYGPKLEAMAKALRKDTGNPDLRIGVVQLAKYLWVQNDQFSPIREAQRRFVEADPHAVLYSTIPYTVNAKDKIHLETESYIQLGEQIGEFLAAVEQGREYKTPGPIPTTVHFADSEQKEIAVEFAKAKDLHGGDAADQWYVTDAEHRGFKDGGFVPVASVETDAAGKKVVLKLAEPAGADAAVSYGYRSDVGGTLYDGDKFPAPAFVKAKVESKP